MTKKFLDSAKNVVTRFKEMCGKYVSKGVTADMFDFPGIPDCFLNSPLENRFMNVVSPLRAGLCVLPTIFLREDPLPSPLGRGRWGISDPAHLASQRDPSLQQRPVHEWFLPF